MLEQYTTCKAQIMRQPVSTSSTLKTTRPCVISFIRKSASISWHRPGYRLHLRLFLHFGTRDRGIISGQSYRLDHRRSITQQRSLLRGIDTNERCFPVQQNTARRMVTTSSASTLANPNPDGHDNDVFSSWIDNCADNHVDPTDLPQFALRQR